MSTVEVKSRSKKQADTMGSFLDELSKNRAPEPIGEIPTEVLPLVTSIAPNDTVTVVEHKVDDVVAQVTKVEADSTGQPLKIRVDLLDDSPYQYRQVYDNETIDQLATSMELNGQSTPIRVRKKGGRFEIISGHRRTRAARSRGWELIDGFTVEVDDLQVACDVIAANEQEDIGDYERACGYRRLVDLGQKQTQIADKVGVSKSLVSGRLKFMEFPPMVIEALNIHPRTISYHMVAPLLEIIEHSPMMVSDVAQGIKMVAAGEWKASSLVSILRKRIGNSEKPESEKNNYLAISDGDSRPILTMRKLAKGKVEIQLESGIDQEIFIKHLSHMLREEASKDASLMGGYSPDVAAEPVSD